MDLISNGFRYEAHIQHREEFATKRNGTYQRTYILSDDARALEVSFAAYVIDQNLTSPSLLLELYVDGILRNVLSPKTGRGLAHLQFAESKINRGVICLENGEFVTRKFRFVELDLDDAILTSRVVSRAGSIELRVVDTSDSAEDEDNYKFDIPKVGHDRSAISFMEGELNNITGIRFDEVELGLTPCKVNGLEKTIIHMVNRQLKAPRKLLAWFDFVYGDQDLLNQLGVIPEHHLKYDDGIAYKRSRKIPHSRRTELTLRRSHILEAAYQTHYDTPGEILTEDGRVICPEGGHIDGDAAEESEDDWANIFSPKKGGKNPGARARKCPKKTPASKIPQVMTASEHDKIKPKPDDVTPKRVQRTYSLDGYEVSRGPVTPRKRSLRSQLRTPPTTGRGSLEFSAEDLSEHGFVSKGKKRPLDGRVDSSPLARKSRLKAGKV